MKLGIFGGSFDPIHAGHIEPVIAARDAVGLDRVLYLPTATPPHKLGARMAPALARYTMVELALLEHEGLYASPLELVDDGPSYTVETLESLRRDRPTEDLHLLIGTDSLANFDRWRRWQDIPELARLVVMARPGWDLEAVAGELPDLLSKRLRDGQILVVEEVRRDISSTRLRELFAAGRKPQAEFVSPLVLDYIRKYSLYQ